MSIETRLKSTLVAAVAAFAVAGSALPASAAPFAAKNLVADRDVVSIGHRHHHHYHRSDAGAAAAAVGVGAFALGLLAGSAANQPPTVVYTPEPVYRPAPRVIYRQAPARVYDCHIERTRTWDPYAGGYVINDRRVCY